MSDVSYLTNSGISENVKPRYTNGKFFTFLDNQMHMGNFYCDGIDYHNYVIRSPIDQPDNLPFYDYYDYEIGDGDVIKGMTKIYGRTVLFKNKKFGIFYNGNLEREFLPGLSSDAAFFVHNEDIYYISNIGLHIFTGGEVVNVKNAVKTYFDAATSYANATVFYFDNKDRVIWSLRADRSFIYNLKYKLWMYYLDDFAFRGYFKNYDNEYIAWTQTNFYEIMNGTTKDYQYDGGDGSSILCRYITPLFKFTRDEGELVTPIGSRLRIRMNSTDLFNFYVYDFQKDSSGKTLVQTEQIPYQGKTTDAAVVNIWFDNLLGESYYFKLEGYTPNDVANNEAVFELHGYTIEYDAGGFNL